MWGQGRRRMGWGSRLEGGFRGIMIGGISSLSLCRRGRLVLLLWTLDLVVVVVEVVVEEVEVGVEEVHFWGWALRSWGRVIRCRV